MNYSVISMLTEPVLTFGILFLFILIVSILFQNIRRPGIVGLLLAGTTSGPLGLGLIETAGIIEVLGKIGLLYLMFLAGLGINMDQFKKEKKNTAIFGVLTFIIPQTTGTLIFYRSEEHTSELQSRGHLVCRLLLEKKKTKKNNSPYSHGKQHQYTYTTQNPAN